MGEVLFLERMAKLGRERVLSEFNITIENLKPRGNCPIEAVGTWTYAIGHSLHRLVSC
jgi:hypothetical protein